MTDLKTIHAEHARVETDASIAETAEICLLCMDELIKRSDEYLAGWKRAQADYANLKRETDRERAEFFKYANEGLLSLLLPAIDQFEMALLHAPTSTEATWLAGLSAVKGIWESTFHDIGLTQVPTDGPFDPTLHEAVGGEAVDGTPEGKIIRVVQNGWKFHEKLLRPAKVLISK